MRLAYLFTVADLWRAALPPRVPFGGPAFIGVDLHDNHRGSIIGFGDFERLP